MKFKGSDGNWDISQEQVNGIEYVCIREQKEYDNENNRLVSLISPVTEYDERDFWNAKLIMCAPELLEMIKEFEVDLRHGYVVNKNRLNKIQSLISKASE